MSAPSSSFFVHSYGCQMNKLDSELVISKLVEAGFAPASRESEANIVLLNTCSVRQHAEDRVWSKLGVLRQRKRSEPELVVGMLGCMAEEHQRYVQSRMPHVDLVVGPSAFGDIDKQVSLAVRRNQTLAKKNNPLGKAPSAHIVGAGVLAVGDGVSGDTITRNVKVRPHRSQAWVSIMRGCNMPCSYCIVPTTRGIEVSRPVAAIVEEVARLCDDGVTEITLLGQTVNAYGRDLGPGVTLAVLLRALHEIPMLRRIAFITSHPNFLSKDLLQAFVELPKLARYLHLPAQSGSDALLKSMRRGYTVAKYLDRVDALRAMVTNVELHSDFIVGYPGETEADLEATAALMERVRFAQSYVFKYSPRPGTLAAKELVDDISEVEKERRNQVLLAIQERHTMEMHERLVGSVQEVLVEGESQREGRLQGRTQHHRIVHFDSDDKDLFGTYVPIKITFAAAHSLVGELLPMHHHVEAGA